MRLLTKCWLRLTSSLFFQWWRCVGTRTMGDIGCTSRSHQFAYQRRQYFTYSSTCKHNLFQVCFINHHALNRYLIFKDILTPSHFNFSLTAGRTTSLFLLHLMMIWKLMGICTGMMVNQWTVLQTKTTSCHISQVKGYNNLKYLLRLKSFDSI